jgi:putative zinc finger/helix-turn-helix YgiT family protein
MICFKCSGEDFAVRTAVVRQDFRGEQFDVTTPVSVCQSCGWQTMGPVQTDELRKRTADTYRKKHGLLTSVEIVSRRTRLGMSQRQFADFLRVGEASVKRWETWQVQDASSNELICLKCEFMLQMKDAYINAIQQYLGGVRWMTTTHWDAGWGQCIQASSGWYVQKAAFSLLNCPQVSARRTLGRKDDNREPDSDYDASINIASAA